MFSLAWQYLTGSAVAAQVADREQPEWPPHPDRVFQALVAAWGERGRDPAERAALVWLETLPPPEVAAADLEGAATVKVYVPVNDSLPDGLERVRKERYFPAVRVGDAVSALRWPGADPGAHRLALEGLARHVTRIGHSSSVVRAWIEDAPPEPSWVPTREGHAVDQRLRVPEPGRLASLEKDFAEGGHAWRRPRPGAWQPYARHSAPEVASGHLAGPMLVLRRTGGAVPALPQTLALTNALRAALIRCAPSPEVIALLSGHAANGAPLAVPHAAYLPLPFVGSPYADGHLLGMALALPATLTADEEDGVFRALVAALHPETGALELPFANGRTVSLVVEDRAAPPVALRPSTWSRASTTWSTATPVVLDRQAPRRHPDRDGHAREAIAAACVQAGLPAPIETRIVEAPVLEGAPAARAFPPLPTKQGLQRRHVHAWMRFPLPVQGPVILGAGRYRGYGLCRPLHQGEDR